MFTLNANQKRALKDWFSDQVRGVTLNGPFYGSLMAGVAEVAAGLGSGDISMTGLHENLQSTYPIYIAWYFATRSHYVLNRLNGGDDPALNDVINKMRKIHEDGRLVCQKEPGCWVVEDPHERVVRMMDDAEFRRFRAEEVSDYTPLVMVTLGSDEVSFEVVQGGVKHSDRGPAIVTFDRETKEVDARYYQNGREIDGQNFEPKEDVQHVNFLGM